jgi:hypothetical protein
MVRGCFAHDCTSLLYVSFHTTVGLFCGGVAWCVDALHTRAHTYAHTLVNTHRHTHTHTETHIDTHTHTFFFFFFFFSSFLRLARYFFSSAHGVLAARDDCGCEREGVMEEGEGEGKPPR